MKKKIDKPTHEESLELRWPDGQPRTRIQDRVGRSAWKQNMAKVKEGLRQELERSGATASLITFSTNPLEPGAAVWFSRKATNQFAWQEGLGLVGELPTIAEIDRAYQQRARRVHPDGPTPDITLFQSLSEHRQRAKEYVTGAHRNDHEFVIAIDIFDEVRLNLHAIKIVLYSLRRIEDCGSPLMLERAWMGFHKQITSGESHGPTAA